MLATALFYGSVWGLGEATLGHLLHLARVPGLPGLVMFPFAVLVMGRVLARSGSAPVVFLTGAVAAGFKFFDLLLPGTDILAIINPAQAILLEALAGAVWVALTKKGTFLLFPEPIGNARLKNADIPIFPR
jgi:H+/gluconate symporter-like permease